MYMHEDRYCKFTCCIVTVILAINKSFSMSTKEYAAFPKVSYDKGNKLMSCYCIFLFHKLQTHGLDYKKAKQLKSMFITTWACYGR